MPFTRAYTRCASLRRRMIPTVLMLDPEVVTFTAKVKIVPITSRRMLTQRLKLLDSFVLLGSCGAVATEI